MPLADPPDVLPGREDWPTCRTRPGEVPAKDPAPAEDEYVDVTYLRPVIDHVVRQGHARESCERILGVDLSAVPHAGLRVARSGFLRLLDWAERELGDPDVGLHMGRSMRFQHTGILGSLVLCARDAAEIMELQCRYRRLLGNALVLDYQLDGGQILLRVHRRSGRTDFHRHACEYNVAGWLNLSELLVGRDVQLNRVQLPYPRPPDDRELQALFGAPIDYDAPFVEIAFDARYAKLRPGAWDPALRRVLEAQAEQRLREIRSEWGGEDELGRIRQIIRERLPLALPRLDEIASEAGLSVRKLQRMLSRLDTSFSDLVDEQRRDLSERYVGRSDLSLVDVSLLLGFANQSSFIRAFKRWFGVSPGRYRDVHARESALAG